MTSCVGDLFVKNDREQNPIAKSRCETTPKYDHIEHVIDRHRQEYRNESPFPVCLLSESVKAQCFNIISTLTLTLKAFDSVSRMEHHFLFCALFYSYNNVRGAVNKF